ncbi:hypothetical protein AAU61_20405 [Desulfocarbo indianensis]|nr:hypothetical protein AAU61_20405 [Desulfocarbo indianensis]
MSVKNKAWLQCRNLDQVEPGVELIRARGMDNRFARHSHRSYCLGMVEEGSRVILQGGRTTLIPSGALFILAPGEPHACRSAQPSGHAYSVLRLPVEYLLGAARRQGLAALPSPQFRGSLLADPGLAESFRRVAARLTGGGPIEKARAALTDLAAGLWARSPAQSPPRPRPARSGPVARACQYLESHCGRTIPLSSLARAAGASPFHLHRQFVAAVGCSPRQYHLQRRVAKARELLLQGLPPSRVALETGFYDQGHLTRQFKNLMGVTPAWFAKINQAARF